MEKIISKINAPKIILLVSVLCMGLFLEFLSCAAAVGMCAVLVYFGVKNNGVKIKINLSSIAIAAISLFYGISAIWAVDSGMSVIGFFKFLPMPLFMLIIMQYGNKPSEYLSIIPYAAVFMTIISAALSFVPSLSDMFAPAGRLAGFFQYSNTYALFALIALIMTAMKNKIKIRDYFYIVILISGIILSGSRTVFILTIVSVIVIIISGKNHKFKIIFLLIIFMTASAAAVYALITGNFGGVGRFLTASLGESTFIGRVLYWYDAVPLILKHPFGTGYQGYYYLQGSVQTGQYTVRFVHNDFLQIMLDIGWLLAIIFIAAAIYSFFKRTDKCSFLRDRLILFVMSAHCFFDFDLQYVAIFMIFILFLDFDSGKEINISGTRCKISFVIVGIVAFYMMISLAAAFFGNYKLSRTLYLWNTDVNIKILANEHDIESINTDADKIISCNKYVAIAYSAKAEVAYYTGDFDSMTEYKDKIIAIYPFDHEEYEDYIYKLIAAVEFYTQSGNIQGAEHCREKLTSVLNDFYSMEDKLSYLGKRINDQPVTELPPELVRLIEETFDVN